MSERWTPEEEDVRQRIDKHMLRYMVSDIVLAALILVALLVIGGLR